MDVAAYFAERGALVDRHLAALVPPPGEAAAPRPLQAAMRHLLFPGGKRLRPVLAMAASEAVGGTPEAALPVAAAVELVHTYSLIHDDLPCIDDDTERRGGPTVHVAFDEALAVLAGDALLALAFEVLSSGASGAARLETERVLATVGELAAAAGATALVGGQVDDLALESCAGPGDELAEQVESIHRRKSAALLTAAITGGARLGGAGETELEVLRRFGGDVGVAFQIADDLLDQGNEDGCSLVRVFGPERARARAEVLLDGALGLIEDWGDRAEPLRECARSAVRRSR